MYYIAGSDKTDPASFGQAHPFADLKVAGNLVIDQRFVLFTHADIYWVTPDLTQTGSPPLLQKHLPVILKQRTGQVGHHLWNGQTAGQL